jgi:diguanylate cyclase (GGDEF)-like protein/PAS domain S-box-containing protein
MSPRCGSICSTSHFFEQVAACNDGVHMDEPPPNGADHERRVLRVYKNETGVILRVNGPVTQVLGWSEPEMLGKRSLEFIHPQDHDAALTSWAQLLRTPGGQHRTRLRHLTAAEHWIWMDVTNHNRLDEADYRAVVTELVPSVDAMPHELDSWVSGHTLRRLTDALPLGVLQMDTAGRIVFRNERLGTMLGDGPARTALEEFANVVAADRSALADALTTVLTGPDVDLQIAIEHPTAGLRYCDVRLRALSNRAGDAVVGVILCVADVTEERRRQAEIERRAAYDGLTDCLNRTSVFGELRAALDAVDTGLAVVFIDLDRFKPINDKYGHAVGDRVLQVVAERLRGATREADSGDIVGRTGGDEFLVVCPAMPSLAAAQRLGARVAAAVQQPLEIGDALLEPSCSVGVAWTSDPHEDVDALVARADAAMYASKRANG